VDKSALTIQDLVITFETTNAKLHAVNGVSLSVNEGEVLGVVGESGSGKSTLALAIMQLLPIPPAKIQKGSDITFAGKNLLQLSEGQMEKIRGRGIGMIFQEPLTSLNPVLTIGDQLGEAVRIGMEKEGTKIKKPDVKRNSIAWLRKVSLPDPEKSLQKYPYELSGGMRQRVVIAMALATKPSLILADEPTSALDVTTQAQIIDLLKTLIREANVSVIFISHDLAVVAQIADRLTVMYAGIIVESAKTSEIFHTPLHPYTEALIACLPDEEFPDRRLEVISGGVPDMSIPLTGCPFLRRCKYAMIACEKMPELRQVTADHYVACWLR
jgi:oligopeptide/dipeptide ABC transporter ATP-binding protein